MSRLGLSSGHLSKASCTASEKISLAYRPSSLPNWEQPALMIEASGLRGTKTLHRWAQPALRFISIFYSGFNTSEFLKYRSKKRAEYSREASAARCHCRSRFNWIQTYHAGPLLQGINV